MDIINNIYHITSTNHYKKNKYIRDITNSLLWIKKVKSNEKEF